MIIYEGPSRLNKRPVVAIVTSGSKNLKTGAQDQLWILDASESPASAVASGSDVSVCGLCRHRRSLAATTGADPCYVLVFRAPRSVWEAYKRGSYAGRTLTPTGSLRLGAYGDPAALPGRVVARLVRRWRQHGHTGFTHQWRTATHLRRYCMASVDTLTEQREAARRGWRTFRVGAAPTDGEIACPAAKESGRRTTCNRCGLCNGSTENDRRKHITINAH
jgi:hypothetical protein